MVQAIFPDYSFLCDRGFTKIHLRSNNLYLRHQRILSCMIKTQIIDTYLKR